MLEVTMVMGCVTSSQRVDVANTTDGEHPSRCPVQNAKETVLAALVRLDEEISRREKSYPVQRFTVVSAELDSIRAEINIFEETTAATRTSADTYAKTVHQMFVSLGLYRQPILALENEDFIANVNRKEMRRIELNWLRTRHEELQKEKTVLHAQILRIRSLYEELQYMNDNFWSNHLKLATPFEDKIKRARALRDALASVSVRLRAAAEYTHAAARAMDDALLAWKLTSVGKSGWERTLSCADACRLLVRARCLERAARRVLSAYSAPRAARALRLALDYAFTDTLHDLKYQKATETLVQFKEAIVQLINSIHQVLLNNMDNLAVAEKNVETNRKDLRTVRVNDIVKKGLADLTFDPELLKSLNLQGK